MRFWVLYALVVMAMVFVTVSAQNSRIRLVSTSQKQTEGRLEVNYGNNWWAVCKENIPTLGDWVCKQLGYGTLKQVADFGRALTGTSAIGKMTCSASATLDQCVRSEISSKCDHGGLICTAQPCVVTDFGAWSACSVQCGGGTQEQSRTVQTPPTQGLTCPPLLNSQPCNTQPCPVDCVWSEWSAWGNCSRACDGGVQKRTRTVVTASTNGGQSCSSETEKFQACNNQPCGQACVVGDWSVWSDCDLACNGGTKFRLRNVLSPPTFGGAACPITNQTFPCNTAPCPMDCIVSEWSAWGTCSLDCVKGNDTGTQLQTRYVTNQPAFGGTPCPSLSRQQPCNTQLCPEDCDLSDWSEWTPCTKQCGTGSMERTRTIEKPPANGGLPCGDLKEADPCNTARCPEDRAAILVDRIRKLELQDRINTLEELQAKQAAELAASQTADLLSQVGGASQSTGGAAPSFLEEVGRLLHRHSQQLLSSTHQRESAQYQQRLASLNSFKSSIDNAKAELRLLLTRDPSPSVSESDSDSTVAAVSADASANDEDELTDEVDAEGHHHKKHHHRRRSNTPNSDSKFSQTAPAPPDQQLEPVPPLFGHTVAIPAGNNND